MFNAASRSTPRPAFRGGSGEPVLLLHGFGLNWQSWGAVIDDLQKDFDVYAPTLPGHWGADPLPGPIGVLAIADVLEEMLDNAGWRTAHIAGNSLGGWLAFELALRGRARSITGIAPPGGWRPNGPEGAALRRKVGVLSSLVPLTPIATFDLTWPIFRKALLPFFVHRPHLVPTELGNIALQAPSHCALLRELVNGPDVMEGLRDLAGLDAPATVLSCRHDLVIPPAVYSKRFIDDVPGIRHRMLDDVGHVPMLEAPELIAEEIRMSMRWAETGEDAAQAG